MLKNIVIVILLVIILTGCSMGTTYDKLSVNEVEVKTIYVPDDLLKTCKPDRPLNREKYLELKLYERERYLTSYIIYLLKTIKKCDIQIDKIKKLNTKI